MSKTICKKTNYFRENNLYETLRLLSSNFSDKSEKVILLVGASAEELISLRILALRHGLEDYKLIGVNNDNDQIKRFYKINKIQNISISFDDKKGDFKGILESDVRKGFVSIPEECDIWCKDFIVNDICFKNVSLVHGDILKGLIFANEITFNAVICNNLLVHFDENEKILAIRYILNYVEKEGFFVRDRCMTHYDWELLVNDPNREIEDIINKMFVGETERVTSSTENIYKVL